MGGESSTYEKKKRIAHRIHVRKPKGKWPLGRPKRWWKDVKINLKENRLRVEWINLAKDRKKRRALVNTAIKIAGSMRGISRLAKTTISFSRRTLLHAASAHSRVCSSNFTVTELAKDYEYCLVKCDVVHNAINWQAFRSNALSSSSGQKLESAGFNEDDKT